jgi:hypothetical protein
MLGEFSFPLRFVLCVLALWRLGHFITAEDGPWHVVVRIRARLGDSMPGRAMDCFYCTSLWLAIPFCFLVAERAWSRVVCWLALSGAASLLEQASTAMHTPSASPRPSDRERHP